jgi:hypothetical protein
MVFQATQNAPTELEELSVERDVEADGYIVGFEDTGGSFVEVGRLENLADDITRPLEIKHQNSGERITLDGSGFETSGGITVGGSVQSTDELNFRSLTSDPLTPATGDMWYRSDIDAFRLQTNSGVQTLTTTEQKDLTPESVAHQYKGANFSSNGWLDSVGDSDLNVNGVDKETLSSISTPAGGSDGVDDFALSQTAAPANIPQTSKFSVALLFKSSDKSLSRWLGVVESGGIFFEIIDDDFFDGSNGEIGIKIRDNNSNLINVESDVSVVDSQPHLVVFNVDTTQGASGVDIYVDDMQTGDDVSTTINKDTGFDNSNYSASSELAVFARNENGTVDSHKDVTFGLVEFNRGLYTESERLDLKSGRGRI